MKMLFICRWKKNHTVNDGFVEKQLEIKHYFGLQKWKKVSAKKSEERSV